MDWVVPRRTGAVILASCLTVSACSDSSIFDNGTETGATSAIQSDSESGVGDAPTADTGAADSASSGGSDAPGADSGDPTGTELSGEELYAGLCSGCHGAEGIGSALGYELRHHTEAHFEWVVRNGRPGAEFPNSAMTAYTEAALSPGDAGKILAYLDAFPPPETSEALYLDYCGNCHGPDGSGGVSLKEITGKSFADVQEKVREGIALGNVGAQTAYMPAFDTARISDDELQLIVDFIGG